MKAIKAKAKTAVYEGFIDDRGIVNFLGIRYAKPPKRWKRAKKLDASDEVIEAKKFGCICPQPILPEEHEEGTPMSEDCLSLNIWTADVEIKGKPVMVWIHGGCYMTGSNRIPYYCNDKFCADCPDIVFVNINYRLGNFGSMDLSMFDESGEYEDAPNLQTFDQMAAIEWVYENIEAFGGDPENITVYGQSAGSYSIATLMLIPEVNKYIKKTICESSGFDKTQKTPVDSLLMGKTFADLAGCKSVEGLLELSMEKILEIEEKIFEDPRFPRAFASVRNGKPIPVNPYEELKKGVAGHITQMAGTVEGEYDTAVFGMTDEEAKERMLTIFKDRITEDTIDAFAANDPERTPREVIMDMRADMMIRMPILTILEAQCQSGADTYMYFLAYKPKGAKLRTQHCFEIPFFNDKLELPVHMEMRFDDPVQGHDPDRSLVPQIQGCWANFARTGNPGGSHIGIEWPKYDMDTKSIMVLDNDGWHVEKDFKAKDTAILQHLLID